VRPFYQDPLYPYALACLMGVVGSDVAGLRVASAALGTITPLVVTWAGRIGLGRVEGLLAGWATALYAPLIFADGSLEKEGLATFCTALALGLTAHLARAGRLGLASIAGASWGVVGLLRSNALVVAPLAAIWLALGGSAQPRPDRQRGLRRRSRDLAVPLVGRGFPDPALPPRRSQQGFRLALAYLAGFLLALTPVMAINWIVSKPREFLGTTWQLGPNFYIGNGPEATGTYMAPPFVRPHPVYEAADYAAEAMRRCGGPLTPGQVSRFWLKEGLRQWAGAPLDSVRLLLRKLGLVTHRFEIPDNQDIEFVRIVAAPALGWGIVDFGTLFPLAALGLARTPRTRYWWFLSLATGLGLAATALFFVVGRYRVPWVPGLALLAAAGVVDLYHRVRHRDWRGLAWRLGLVGLPAVILSWRPQADPAPARWGNQLIALALAELRAGQVDPAIDTLDLARASSAQAADRVRQLSGHPPFHHLLSEAIHQELGKGQTQAAASPAPIRQARLLRQLPERSAQARTLLEASLRVQPDDAAANRELGALLLAWPEGRLDRGRAVTTLERAFQNPAADLRATLLLALATSQPRWLDQAPVKAGENSSTLTTLVRAMLASR
jgi:hypothetical protein